MYDSDKNACHFAFLATVLALLDSHADGRSLTRQASKKATWCKSNSERIAGAEQSFPSSYKQLDRKEYKCFPNLVRLPVFARVWREFKGALSVGALYFRKQKAATFGLAQNRSAHLG